MECYFNPLAFEIRAICYFPYDVHPHILNIIIGFQQYGGLPQFGVNFRKYLGRLFTDRGSKRLAIIERPPRTTELTPSDNFKIDWVVRRFQKQNQIGGN